MDRLLISQHMAKTALDPFVIGENDCALWCADLAKAASGIDVAADLRGTYSTKFQYRQIIMKSGGLLSLIRSRMNRAGFDPLSDAGVAVAIADEVQICGIYLDGRFVVKGDRMVKIHDKFTLLEGWSWSKQ